jgi:hypothetical protein
VVLAPQAKSVEWTGTPKSAGPLVLDHCVIGFGQALVVVR